ncbi:hypothetical protein EVG20_g6970 [Dentipellis fragilis]|uniref:Uncharacterized protein n=1 Tax=Dentipellis fragilis TaxID=205917 RepID=A0A4Y9YIK4_9AGAM|nr:hypothetical protein EVG20_g6970 [Dentipellis fragilis]
MPRRPASPRPSGITKNPSKFIWCPAGPAHMSLGPSRSPRHPAAAIATIATVMNVIQCVARSASPATWNSASWHVILHVPGHALNGLLNFIRQYLGLSPVLLRAPASNTLFPILILHTHVRMLTCHSLAAASRADGRPQYHSPHVPLSPLYSIPCVALTHAHACPTSISHTHIQPPGSPACERPPASISHASPPAGVSCASPPAAISRVCMAAHLNSRAHIHLVLFLMRKASCCHLQHAHGHPPPYPVSRASPPSALSWVHTHPPPAHVPVPLPPLPPPRRLPITHAHAHTHTPTHPFSHYCAPPSREKRRMSRTEGGGGKDM